MHLGEQVCRAEPGVVAALAAGSGCGGGGRTIRLVIEATGTSSKPWLLSPSPKNALASAKKRPCIWWTVREIPAAIAQVCCKRASACSESLLCSFVSVTVRRHEHPSTGSLVACCMQPCCWHATQIATGGIMPAEPHTNLRRIPWRIVQRACECRSWEVACAALVLHLLCSKSRN